MGRRRLKTTDDTDTKGLSSGAGVIVDEVVSGRNCYLCSQDVRGAYEIKDETQGTKMKIDVFINALSEVCEIPVESVLEATTDETTVLNLNRVVFCDGCQFNLHKFRDIKFQLEVLKEELSQIKGLISTAFFTKSLQQDDPSKGRAKFLPAADHLPETVTGSLKREFKEVYLDEQYEEMVIELEPTSEGEGVDSISTHPDPDWDPLASRAPKSVGRVRRTSPGNNKSVGGLRAQKARLRALLKRQQNSKRLKTNALLSPQSNNRGRKNRNQRISTFKFRCPSCSRKLPTEELLRYHVRKMHEGHPTPYDCQKCEVQFQRLAELRRHFRKVCRRKESTEPIQSTSDTADKSEVKKDPNPTLEFKMICDECGASFKSKAGFRLHLNRQGGQCTPPIPKALPLNSKYDKTEKKIHRYICGVCGKKYRSPHHLGIHIRAVHTDGFVFLCEYCCKPFNSTGSLKGHQRVNHLEEFLAAQNDAAAELEKIRNLTCSICQMVFTSYHSKRYHEARHTDNYQYFCDVCGSGWTSLMGLKLHARSHGEKKFKCTECDHTFDRTTKRDRHMRAKHGLGDKTKTLKCQFCDKCFWDTSHLKRHVILLHPNPDQTEPLGYGCTLCSYDCAIREYIIIHSKTKKHMQRVEMLGLTNPYTGIRFPESNAPARRSSKKSEDTTIVI